MSRVLIFLFLACAAIGQTRAELREHLVKVEGYSTRPYLVRGIAHVGIGHRVYGVPRPLTKREVEIVFTADLNRACAAAYGDIATFSRHPKPVRIMLVAIAFNVGPTGFHQFYQFRAAIDRFDYRAASAALSNSLWAKELPNRAAAYTAILTP